MSACISSKGEYGEHAPSEDDRFTCSYCHVVDEEALRAEVERLGAQVEAVRQEGYHQMLGWLGSSLAAAWQKAEGDEFTAILRKVQEAAREDYEQQATLRALGGTDGGA